MEEIDLYNIAMENAYNLIVGNLALDELMLEMDEEDEDDLMPLPFNPFQNGGKIPNEMIDIVIEYYSSLEQYERCAELVEAKDTDV